MTPWEMFVVLGGSVMIVLGLLMACGIGFWFLSMIRMFRRKH